MGAVEQTLKCLSSDCSANINRRYPRSTSHTCQAFAGWCVVSAANTIQMKRVGFGGAPRTFRTERGPFFRPMSSVTLLPPQCSCSSRVCALESIQIHEILV